VERHIMMASFTENVHGTESPDDRASSVPPIPLRINTAIHCLNKLELRNSPSIENRHQDEDQEGIGDYAHRLCSI